MVLNAKPKLNSVHTFLKGPVLEQLNCVKEKTAVFWGVSLYSLVYTD